MSGSRVLVAGASIAGPALAHWLRRRGAEVTVVERAPSCVPVGVRRWCGVLEVVSGPRADYSAGVNIGIAGWADEGGSACSNRFAYGTTSGHQSGFLRTLARNDGLLPIT